MIGLGANALLGWWWADPVARLVVVLILGKEGTDALHVMACGCNKG
jgi:divalent metal cation (Fe/Co/Zn/Cd) transporter